MADEKITVQLDVQGNASKELKKATTAISDFGKTATSSLSSASQIFNVFAGNVLAKGFTSAISAASNASRQLFNLFVTDGIAAAQIQEDAINSLNSALIASGKFTEATSKSLQEYASALQESSRFGDEAILNAQSLLQNLGQLDEKGLKEATQASLDLAAALKIDLTSAAQLVGRAAAGEVGTFSRFGVSIKKGANDAETFSNALKVINTQFGGAAARDVQTFSGATQQLSNTFGDLQEVFGTIVTENEVILAVITEVNKIFKELQGTVGDNKDSFGDFVSGGVITSIEALQVLNQVIAVISVNFLKLQRTLVAGFGLVESAGALIGLEESKKRVIALGDTLESLDQKIRNFEEGTTVFDEIGASIQRVKAAAEGALEADTELADGQIENNQRRVDSIGEITEEQQKAIDAAVKRTEAIIDAGLTERQKLAESLNALQEDRAKRLITEQQFLQAQTTLNKKFQDLQIKNEEQQQKTRDQLSKEREENLKSSLGSISSLTRSSSKELFAIGKAAAFAQAVIDGQAAIQKALAAAPPPFNFILAALVGTAQAVQLSKIASQEPPGFQAGLTEVPSGFPNDSFPARLTSGERVVDAQANQDLKLFLETNANNGALLSALIERFDKLENQIVVNIGGEEIINTIIDQERGGRTLGVV